MVKVPSASGVMMVSRKGKEPSSLASSTVNWMEGSTVLMWSRNSSLCEWCWITKAPSTYLFHILGGCSAVEMALFSKASMYILATIGLTPWQLLLSVHRTHPGTGSRGCSSRTPAALWCYQLSWWINLGDLHLIPHCNNLHTVHMWEYQEHLWKNME